MDGTTTPGLAGPGYDLEVKIGRHLENAHIARGIVFAEARSQHGFTADRTQTLVTVRPVKLLKIAFSDWPAPFTTFVVRLYPEN